MKHNGKKTCRCKSCRNERKQKAAKLKRQEKELQKKLRKKADSILKLKTSKNRYRKKNWPKNTGMGGYAPKNIRFGPIYFRKIYLTEDEFFDKVEKSKKVKILYKDCDVIDTLLYLWEKYEYIDAENAEQAILRKNLKKSSLIEVNPFIINKIKKKHSLKDKDTVLLWHGTCPGNSIQIVHEGFDIPRTKGLLGRGVYFSPHLTKAINYTGPSVSTILLCEVYLGKMFEVNCHTLDIPEQFDSVHLKQGFTSPKIWNGKIYNGDEFMVRNVNHCIPRYIVCFY